MKSRAQARALERLTQRGQADNVHERRVAVSRIRIHRQQNDATKSNAGHVRTERDYIEQKEIKHRLALLQLLVVEKLVVAHIIDSHGSQSSVDGDCTFLGRWPGFLEVLPGAFDFLSIAQHSSAGYW